MNQLEINYQQALKNVEDSKVALKKAITNLLENGKPCKKGDQVRIVTEYGKIIEGSANTFGILRCEKVYVTSVKIDKKTVYISEPYKTITVL